MILREEDEGGRSGAARRLNRDQVMEISRLSSRENLLCERKNLVFNTSLTFSQWRDLSRSGVIELGSFNNCTSK